MSTFKQFLEASADDYQKELDTAAKEPMSSHSEEFWIKLFGQQEYYLSYFINTYKHITPLEKQEYFVTDNFIKALFNPKVKYERINILRTVINKSGKALPKSLVEPILEKLTDDQFYSLISFLMSKTHPSSLQHVPLQFLNRIEKSPFRAYSYVVKQIGWDKAPAALVNSAKKSMDGIVDWGVDEAQKNGKLPEEVITTLEHEKEQEKNKRVNEYVWWQTLTEKLINLFPSVEQLLKIWQQLPKDIIFHFRTYRALYTWLYWKVEHKLDKDALIRLINNSTYGENFISEIGEEQFINQYSDELEKNYDPNEVSFGAISEMPDTKVLELVKLCIKLKNHIPNYFSAQLFYRPKVCFELGQLFNWDERVDNNMWNSFHNNINVLMEVLTTVPLDKIPKDYFDEMSGRDAASVSVHMLYDNIKPPEALMKVVMGSETGKKAFITELPSINKSELVKPYLIQFTTLEEYVKEVRTGTLPLEESVLIDKLKHDNHTTNFNFVEDFDLSDEVKKVLMTNERFKRFYLVPRKHARSYNEHFAGFFVHSTTNVGPFVRKTPGEICVSTVDANKTFNENLILAGAANIRLLYDFDCYSYVDQEDPKKRRYASDGSEEWNKVDLDKQTKMERLKSAMGEEIGNEYYDEGFADLAELNLFFITGKSDYDVNKAQGLLELPVVEYEKFQRMLKHGKIIEFMYDILDGKHSIEQEEDPEEKYASMVKEAVDKHCQEDDIVIDEDYSDLEPIHPSSPINKITKVFTEESVTVKKFTLSDLTPEEVDEVYKLVNDTYTKSIGESWSKEDFLHASENWVFYGNPVGFITVRPQASGLVKLTGAAGANIPKLRGMKLLISENVPLWGMMTKDVADLASKAGLIKPPGMLTKLLFPLIPKSVFGPVKIKSVQWDGGVVIEDERLGKELVKYFVGNKQYFKTLLDNQNLPDMAKELITKMI